MLALKSRFPESYGYLTSPLAVSPILLSLIFLFLYRHAASPDPFAFFFLLLTGLSFLFLLRLPRWVYYLYLLVSVIAVVAHMVFNISARSGIDDGSDRDEAVEIAALAFLRGENPWDGQTDLNLAITTGPSSILLAIPFVTLTGHINLLTFIFWIGFAASLLWGDVRRQNNTLLLLLVLFMFPETEFVTVLTWSLEELYYPLLLFLAAWWMTGRRWYFAVGLLLAFVVLVRLSYVFAVAGFLLWFTFQTDSPLKPLLKVGAGVAAGAIGILLPFALVGGQNFWARNFLTIALGAASGGGAENVLFNQIQAVGELIPGPARVIYTAGVIGLILVVAAFLARHLRLSHPFWHVSLGALLAHTILFSPGNQADYILTIVIPTFFAVAFSETPA